MKKILYVDASGDNDEIAHVKRLLKNCSAKYETATCDDMSVIETFEKFREEYLPKISEYDIRIEHFGNSVPQYKDLLKNNKNLTLIRLSKIPEDIELNEEDKKELLKDNINPERIKVYGYASSHLIKYLEKLK